ncbi:hypothetical protein BESB_028430 [Besnoitia besnoiti]|uniref:Uncharacterized protein n=1 Tax=Besnoitia besnoiti TaxID=94643 RepID=A0A2A9LY81_BESBE|nr:uncharacterized protein BESB_028430 [Besnoitia besnoiti]PFH31408.1 hypothetical protein BESB_028430 [Besnoitia besnoiti]
MPVATLSPFSARGRAPVGRSTAAGSRRRPSSSVETPVSEGSERGGFASLLSSPACSPAEGKGERAAPSSAYPSRLRKDINARLVSPSALSSAPFCAAVSFPAASHASSRASARPEWGERASSPESCRSSGSLRQANASEGERGAWGGVSASRALTGSGKEDPHEGRRGASQETRRRRASEAASPSSSAIVPLGARSERGRGREGVGGKILVALRGTAIHPIWLLAFHGVRLKRSALISLNLVEACEVLQRLHAPDRDSQRPELGGEVEKPSPSLLLLFCLLGAIAEVHLRQQHLLARDLKVLRLKLQSAESGEPTERRAPPASGSPPRSPSPRPSRAPAAAAPWTLRPRLPVGEGLLSAELYFEALAGPGGRKKASAFRKRKRRKQEIEAFLEDVRRKEGAALALLPSGAEFAPFAFFDSAKDASPSHAFGDTGQASRRRAGAFTQPPGEGPLSSSSAFALPAHGGLNAFAASFDHSGDLLALSRDSATFGALGRRSSISSFSSSVSDQGRNWPDGREAGGGPRGSPSPFASRSPSSLDALSPLFPRSPGLERDAADPADAREATTSSSFAFGSSALDRRDEGLTALVTPPHRRSGASWATEAGFAGLGVEFPAEEYPVGVAIDPRVASPIRVGGEPYAPGRDSEGASSESGRLSSRISSSLSGASSLGRGTPDRPNSSQDWRRISAWAEAHALPEEGGDGARGDFRLSAVGRFPRDEGELGIWREAGEDDALGRDVSAFFDGGLDADLFFAPGDGEVGTGGIPESQTETPTLLALPWEDGAGEGEDGKAAPRKRQRQEKQSSRLTWDAQEQRLAFHAWSARSLTPYDPRNALSGGTLLQAAVAEVYRKLELEAERERRLAFASWCPALLRRPPSEVRAAFVALAFQDALQRRREETVQAERILRVTASGETSKSKKDSGARKADAGYLLDPRDGGLPSGDLLLQRQLWNALLDAEAAKPRLPASLSWDAVQWRSPAERAALAAAGAWSAGERGPEGGVRRAGGDAAAPTGAGGQGRAGSPAFEPRWSARLQPRGPRGASRASEGDRGFGPVPGEEDPAHITQRARDAADRRELALQRRRWGDGSGGLTADGDPYFGDEAAFLGDDFCSNDPFPVGQDTLDRPTHAWRDGPAPDGDAGAPLELEEDEETAEQRSEKQNQLGPSAWNLLAAVKHRVSAAFSSAAIHSGRGERMDEAFFSPKKESYAAPAVSLHSLICGHSRATAACAFRDALLLHAKGFFDLEQEAPRFEATRARDDRDNSWIDAKERRDEGRRIKREDAAREEGQPAFPPVYIHLTPQKPSKPSRSRTPPSPDLSASAPLRATPAKKCATGIGASDLEEELRGRRLLLKKERATGLERGGRPMPSRPHEEFAYSASAPHGDGKFRGDAEGLDSAGAHVSRVVKPQLQPWSLEAGVGEKAGKEGAAGHASASVSRRTSMASSGSADTARYGREAAASRPGPAGKLAKCEKDEKMLKKQESARRALLSQMGVDGADVVVEIEAEADLESCVSASLKRRSRPETPAASRLSSSVCSFTPRSQSGGGRRPLPPLSPSSVASFASARSANLSLAAASESRKRDEASGADASLEVEARAGATPSGEAAAGQAAAPSQPTEEGETRSEGEEGDEDFLVTDEDVEAAVETMVAQLLHVLNEQDRVHSGHLIDWYIAEYVAERGYGEAETERGSSSRASGGETGASRAAVWRRKLHGALETLFEENVLCGEEVAHDNTDTAWRVYWLTGVAAVGALSEEEDS